MNILRAISSMGSSDPWLLTRRYRTRFIVLFLLVATLNFVDRAIMAALAQPIKEELQLTDFQIGALQGLSFALLYSILGIPVGRLAERYSRVLIIAVSVFLFSLMTFLLGTASSFAMLFLFRVGVGVGEAGFMSPTSSLVSDHYPPNRRSSALSVILLGSPLGYLIGAVLGGYIAQEFGWRTAFVAMGLPGCIVAALVLLFLVEPARGLVDGLPPSRAAPPPLRSALRALFAKKTYRHLLAAGILCTFGMVAIGQFSFQFFVRAHGLSLSQAGLASGISTAVALSLGTLIGGFGVDLGSRRDVRWNAWIPAIGVTMGAMFYVTGFLTNALPLSMAALVVGGTSLFLYYAPTYSMTQNIAEPRMRATAVAIYGLAFGLLGTGLGPTFLGFASDRFATASFELGAFHQLCPGGRAGDGATAELVTACRQASAHGIRMALASITVAFLWAAVHFTIAARTLKQDLYRTGPTV